MEREEINRWSALNFFCCLVFKTWSGMAGVAHDLGGRDRQSYLGSWPACYRASSRPGRLHSEKQQQKIHGLMNPPIHVTEAHLILQLPLPKC